MDGSIERLLDADCTRSAYVPERMVGRLFWTDTGIASSFGPAS
jgi:hypothetical protein